MVFALLQRAESGQRGYLLTGRDLYLQPYDAALKALPAALDDIGDAGRRQSACNSSRSRRMRQLVSEKLRELGDTIDDAQGRTDRKSRSLSSTPMVASA